LTDGPLQGDENNRNIDNCESKVFRNISQGRVATGLRCGRLTNLTMNLLQIYWQCTASQWKSR